MEPTTTTIKIRHPETSEELDVTEQTFTEVYQPQGWERIDGGPENLAGMTRDELNAKAVEAGVADPESLPNKAAVIEKIEGHEG